MVEIIFESVADSVFAFFDRLQEKGINSISVSEKFRHVNNLFVQNILPNISLYNIVKIIGEKAEIKIVLENGELEQCTQQESDFEKGINEYCRSKWYVDNLENEISLANRVAEIYQYRKECKKKLNSEDLLEERILEGAGTYFVSSEVVSYKRTLLIFHAYGVRATIWNPFVSLLNNQYRIILFSPEHLENTQNENTSMDGMVNNVTYICEKENIKTCHVLAWCSGAKLATHFLLRNNIDLCRLTILSGNFSTRNDSLSILSDFEKGTDTLLSIPPNSNLEKTLKVYRVLNFKKTEREFWNSCLYYQNCLMRPYDDTANFINYQRLHWIFSTYRYQEVNNYFHASIYNISGEFDIVSSKENLKVVDRIFHNVAKLYLPLGSHWYLVENPIGLCILLHQIEYHKYEFE